ncbi:MAG: PEGA domain-containing protein [Deltaproteobacteria bacterium]|nr:PEGA domain-containing protein [Deltaproteobacteria bacterium]
MRRSAACFALAVALSGPARADDAPDPVAPPAAPQAVAASPPAPTTAAAPAPTTVTTATAPPPPTATTAALTVTAAEAPPATTATAPMVVAVLDLKAGEGATAQAQALTTMLTAEVAALPGKRAISRNELKALMSHQADSQLAGCAEVQCMADVAQLVNATMVVSGTMQRLQGTLALGVTLFDVAGGEARVVGRQEAAWRGSDQDLLLLARPLVQRLFDPDNAGTHKGRVELIAPAGAQVVFDGKDHGLAPLAGPLTDVASGAHRFSLRKDGFAPLDLDVVVARGETTIARGELREIPLTDQPWFWWTAGGVVLVAAGAGALAVLSLEQPTTVVVGKP